MNWINKHELFTDGAEYEMLYNAVQKVKDIDGLILEIGTRKGGSMMIIIDALLESGQENRNVISVDPYGHVEYNSGLQYGVTRFDYTNDMKKQTMIDLFGYVQNKPINFIPICLTSDDFFYIYREGIPIYNIETDVINKIAFAFVDGQHDTNSVLNDCSNITERSTVGTRIVIDNITFFDLDLVEKFMKIQKFQVEEKGNTKITFVCKH
jgi:hypothetical protein